LDTRTRQRFKPRVGTADRLAVASAGTYTASYSYLANSPLVSQISFSHGTNVMSTARAYDYVNRSLSVASTPSGVSAVSYAYAYNPANQRTRLGLADGSYWVYQCENLGQVISGKRYWSDGAPMAGQQFQYGFDDIGNRRKAKAGGDQNGANLRSGNYTPNNLNQYTQRDVPGAADLTNHCFVAFDGNGNVSGLVDASSGANLGQYEYGPFGEPIRATGTLAVCNPLRFSTKYADRESAFLYLGHKFYSPATGRWLSRDLIEEQGGRNLQAFCANDPVGLRDSLGLAAGSISASWSLPINNFGSAGWSIRLRWTPPSDCNCCRCSRVVWIQDMTWTLTKFKIGWPVTQPWTTDWDETDYQANSDAWDCHAYPRGHRLDNADLWDDPVVFGRTWLVALTMDFKADSRVKCLVGEDAGKIYGRVQWGYYYDVGALDWPFSKVTGDVTSIH
jgi:RHS repeat-associated protein